MTAYSTDISFARKMDASDPLAFFRGKFYIPKTKAGEECLYLCGNSLGLQPVTVEAAVKQELDDWKNLGVGGYFHAKNPWLRYQEFVAPQLAKLVGARQAEVVAMNTLTVNLHLMMVSFYRPTKARHKIVIEGGAFPSDQYAVKSQLLFHGFDPKTALIELMPRKGENTLRTEDIEALIEREGESIALILLGGVNYYTGQLYDMEIITKAGHKKGCTVGFDLAHAVGNVPLKLHDWNVDFACWCSYKYLNAGPASVAGCFVHERYAHDTTLPRFAGWWGHDKETRFKMPPDFKPDPGAEGWQLSNSSVLSMAALKASLDIFQEAGMEKLRAKSIHLTGYLEYLLKNIPSGSFEIITPRTSAERGCQLSIRMPQNGKKIFEALTESGVVCDWREPDCIRVTPVPLYNSYTDVYRFAEILEKALYTHSK